MQRFLSTNIERLFKEAIDARSDLITHTVTLATEKFVNGSRKGVMAARASLTPMPESQGEIRNRPGGAEATRYIFRMPKSGLILQPVLQISTQTADKAFLARFEFDGNGEDSTLVPDGLSWSGVLNSPFTYIPAAAAKTTVRLPSFIPPFASSTITIKISPWGQTPNSTPSPIKDIILETTIADRPSLIIADTETPNA